MGALAAGNPTSHQTDCSDLTQVGDATPALSRSGLAYDAADDQYSNVCIGSADAAVAVYDPLQRVLKPHSGQHSYTIT